MEWFRRLGDIPGLDYAGSPMVDRTKLRGHESVPKVISYEFEGKRREGLNWPQERGSGSASPAHHYAFGLEFKVLPTSKLILRMMEGLELPGISSDYHFIIQGCAEALWGRRRDEPEVFETIETLCWLDIRLIEARPDTITNEFGEKRIYRVLAFGRLVELYEREGFLREALEVARRAAVFDQGQAQIERLEARIAALEAEYAGADG
jgi:hypothetical protein